MSGTARLIGVGVGPGDPELVTLKAMRVLHEADVVAHFAKAGNVSRGRAIVAGHIRPGAIELPLLYPVTTEIPKHAPAYGAKIAAFYDDSAAIFAP
jgi:precorrin-2/cobalt-factor-2 C20-methyltransferase